VGLLMPETKAPVRPSLAEIAAPSSASSAEEAVNLQSRILYLRSYLLERAIIGFIGISLPVVLILGDNLLRTDGPALRGSLSVYYYSGMRDLFGGSLFAVGVFLITYKIFERNLNNVLTVIAGLAAMVVAFFPTNRPDGVTVGPTPIQERLGETTVSHVHYTSAGVFIVLLAIISFFFGLQEGRRSPERAGGLARMSPRFWRWFHWFCATATLLAVAFTVLAAATHRFGTYSLLIGEIVAVVSFGLSWLMKGLELDVLKGPRSARRRWSRQAAAENP
jgi:hypothetical protein